MKRSSAMILLLLLTCLSGWAQSPPEAAGQKPQVRKAAIDEYAGTWNSMFGGKPWMILGLGFEGDKLTGWMQHAQDFQFNDQGELKSVGDTLAKETVETAEMSGDGLVITLKNDDTKAIERYLMRIVAPDTAELRMSGMNMPPGMPKPRPWKLTKAEAAK